MDMDNSVVTAGGKMGGQRPDLVCEHMIQSTAHVLWNCTPETCVILLASVTPINSVKRKKMKFKISNSKAILPHRRVISRQ